MWIKRIITGNYETDCMSQFIVQLFQVDGENGRIATTFTAAGLQVHRPVFSSLKEKEQKLAELQTIYMYIYREQTFLLYTVCFLNTVHSATCDCT